MEKNCRIYNGEQRGIRILHLRCNTFIIFPLGITLRKYTIRLTNSCKEILVHTYVHTYVYSLWNMRPRATVRDNNFLRGCCFSLKDENTG